MKQVSFSFTTASSADILANPEVLTMLEEAASGYGGMVHVRNLLALDDKSKKSVLCYENATLLRGAFILTFTDQEIGKVMTMVLLAGTQFNSWTGDLRKFLYKTADEHNCIELYYMGRKGFGRLFPELEEVARVYRAHRPDFDTKA